jgi:hypothetical protein
MLQGVHICQWCEIKFQNPLAKVTLEAFQLQKILMICQTTKGNNNYQP